MASTEARVRALIGENLEVDGKPVDSNMALSSSLGEQGVSSMDMVSFARVLQNEFGFKFAVEQCTELKNLGQLIEFIDSKTS